MSAQNLTGILNERVAAVAGSSTTARLRPFDQPHYRAINQARSYTLRSVLARMLPALSLHTALDVGSGLGFFSQTLYECGLQVRGFDGREENAAESHRRVPHIPFEQGDLEDQVILQLGQFDLVLCFGLLYLLENPLLA